MTSEPIPAEVMRKAEKIGHRWDDPALILDIASSIHEAVLAERERCAKVAETLGVYPELNVFAGGPEWYRHAKEIAAAIRAGGSQ